MPRFHAFSPRALSLRTKVFFLFAGATLLIVVPTLLLVARAVERRVYERATEELQESAQGLSTAWRYLDDNLLKDAIARAQSARLVKAMEQGDLRRVERLLKDRLPRGQIVLAADTAGRPLVGERVDSAILLSGEGVGSILTFPEKGGAPIRVAVWPVWGDSAQLGIVGVGTALDTATIRELKKEWTGRTDLALLVGDSVIGTTLADSLEDDLHRIDLAALLRSRATEREKLGEKPYQIRAYALATRGLPASVVLLRPIENELRIAAGIERTLVAVGLAALVMALALAGIVSRIVARPAQVLAEASSRLARGDYRAPLPPVKGDEIGQLAAAFSEMRTAIAEREGRLRSAQAEMIHREKLAAMGRLVAQLSHEINNPIYNIQNCLEALERRGDPNDPNREFLLLAQEELSRMATLTRQMLDQSRPLSDAATPMDLNQAVQRVLALAGPDLRARGIQVESWMGRGLPTVVAHPDAIQQVLANLVNNAMDAMPEGGVLRIGTRADTDAVEVAVEDTGTGIADDQLPHIFEAFYTTKPGVRGLGLGLFVSEGIIRGHRGRILVESRPGEGSRFVVRLPRETLDEALAAPDPREDAVPAAASPA